MTDDDADELLLPCEACGRETRHALLRTQEGRRGGLTLQGVARCGACGVTGPVRLHEPAPVELELRLSQGAVTRRARLQAEADERLAVGDRRPWAGGTLEITALELAGQRREAVVARERPVVWARDATVARVRIAVHRGWITDSHHHEFPAQRLLRVGDTLTLAGRRATIVELRRHGGSVPEAVAVEVVRATCEYRERRGQRARPERRERQGRPRR